MVNFWLQYYFQLDWSTKSCCSQGRLGIQISVFGTPGDSSFVCFNLWILISQFWHHKFEWFLRRLEYFLLPMHYLSALSKLDAIFRRLGLIEILWLHLSYWLILVQTMFLDVDEKIETTSWGTQFWMPTLVRGLLPMV